MRNKAFDVKRKGFLMSIFGRLRWIGFVLYVGVIFCVPLVLLWKMTGFLVGLGATILFLYLIRVRGSARIAERLSVSKLTFAEAPHVHNLVIEYCRHLNLHTPKIGLIETPAINIALHGFSKHTATLSVTRGALDSLRKPELSALIGRQLTFLWQGEVAGQSWLSQFLSLLDIVVGSPKSEVSLSLRHSYPFALFVKQILLYPFTLVPTFLLKSRSNPNKIDLKAVRLTGKPEALAEGLRLLEALRERTSFNAPFSTLHLFLITPPNTRSTCESHL